MLIVFNKPYGVLSQFTDEQGRPTLADYIDRPGVYAAGRLDMDSEGLLLLTDDGKLKHQLAHPDSNTWKEYLVQVEGIPQASQIKSLSGGLRLKDGPVKNAKAKLLPKKPGFVWKREPPIRSRKNKPTSWISISVNEGRNRMVRRMTAAVDLPTLRLIRLSVGPYALQGLAPGESRSLSDT